MNKSKSIHEGNHFKKYLAHTPWYLLSSLTTKAMGFFLIPLFTSYLSPEEFGTLSTLESLGRILPLFLSLYLDAAFTRYYYQEKSISQHNITTLFSTHFWFILPWGILTCAIFINFSPVFVKDLPSVGFWPIVLIVITQLFNQLALMVTLIWNANLLAKKLAIFQIIMSLLSVVITAYLMVIEDVNWESRIYALAAISLLQFSILLYIALRKSWLIFCFDLSILKRSLKYSVPLIPNIAAGWITMFSDRIILAHFGMLDEVGLYSLAAQIAILIFIINDAITKVQGPIAMSGLTDNVIEAKSRMSQFVTGYFFIITIGFISLILFSRELLYTFTSPEYYRAYLIVPILAGVYVLSGFYRVFTNIISFHNATWLISLAAFIQAIANLLLNFLLIPIFGMFAAAFSTLFSMFLYTAFIFFTSQKLDKIDIDYKTIFKVFAFLLFYLVLGIFIDSVLEVGLVLFILKFLLLASLIICFLYFKINLKYRVKFFNLLSNIVKKIMASKLSDR